jgi:hypothetical protein
MLNTSVHQCHRLKAHSSNSRGLRALTLAVCTFALFSSSRPADAQAAAAAPAIPDARFVSPLYGPPPQVITGATPTLNANKLLMYQTLNQKQSETQLRDQYLQQEQTIEQELAKLPKNVSPKSATGLQESKLQTRLNQDKQYVQTVNNNIDILDRWAQYYQAKAQDHKWNRSQDRQAAIDQQKDLADKTMNSTREAQTQAGTAYWQVLNTPVYTEGGADGWSVIPIHRR